MASIVLVRPGATDFDDQGRIKGTLEIPLNERGAGQVAQMIRDLSRQGIVAVYSSPCQCAEQSAAGIAAGLKVRWKSIEKLANVDRGLWHGKRVEEVRQCQPKVYRQMQEHPETVCPPSGEPFADAQQRVLSAVEKLRRKHNAETIALVLPEPIYSVVRSELLGTDLGDLWKAECECGGWEAIAIEAARTLVRG
ncbi:MAG: histidine phosphatase family protein [Planctomycetota bacterium]